MLTKIKRMFVIKTRWEACAVIYALALGAVERGTAYTGQYPGWPGKILFAACTCSVFMAGAKIFECLRYEKAARVCAPAASNDNEPSGLATERRRLA